MVILTHRAPAPADVPKGKSKLIFVSDIQTAVEMAKTAAGDKCVSIGGASAAQQALRAGLVDELHLHVAPILLGAGVRLFDHLGSDAIRLERIKVLEAPHVTHLRYRVVR